MRDGCTDVRTYVRTREESTTQPMDARWLSFVKRIPKATFLDSLLEFDDKKKLHNGGNISNTTDDNDDNLELLDCEEHRPKWKRAPNLFQECRNRNGKDERLGEIAFRNDS